MHSTVIRAALIAGAALGLSACADDYYGYGGGVGYAPAYAGGYYDGPYDGYYGNPYGYNYVPYGYAGAGFGWYGGYYYPGSGYYVYDRGGHRREWSGRDRDYWRSHGRGDGGRGYLANRGNPGGQAYGHGGYAGRPGAIYGQGDRRGYVQRGGQPQPQSQGFTPGGRER